MTHDHASRIYKNCAFLFAEICAPLIAKNCALLLSGNNFSKEAADLIRQGKPLTGEGGVFTPLIKQVLEAALEGEMEAHLAETRQPEANRRNGRAQKISKARWAALRFLPPATAIQASNPK